MSIVFPMSQLADSCFRRRYTIFPIVQPRSPPIVMLYRVNWIKVVSHLAENLLSSQVHFADPRVRPYTVSLLHSLG